MKKGLYIVLIMIFMGVALLSSCAKGEEAAPTPELTPTVTPLPSVEDIPDTSITLIFSASENQTYNSLYHQLAYIKLENLGYNISNLYANEGDDLLATFSSLDSQGMEYIVLTSSVFNEQAQSYKQNIDTNIVFIQYGDYYMDEIISYQVKLYEYYYLAGAALCSESTSNVAGFLANSPDEQTIRCINAFALGMKSMDKDAVVIINWTDTPQDEVAISQSIDSLKNQNCDVLAYFMPGDLVEKVAGNSGLSYMSASTHTPLDVNANLAIKPTINLDSYYAGILDTPSGNLEYGFSYLGIGEHIVSYELSTSVSEQTSAALNSAYTNIQNGYEVFSGPIYNELGLIVPEGSSLPEADILHMLWFVDNVVGEVPAG